MRLPVYDLVSNWAYMVMATLAWNIQSWFAMMRHLKGDRDAYIRMEFRRFMNRLILIPCRIVRWARSIVVRIIGYQPTLDRLFSAWNTIERTGFGERTRGQTSSLPVAEGAIRKGFAVNRKNSTISEDLNDGAVTNRLLAFARGISPVPMARQTSKMAKKSKHAYLRTSARS